MTELSAAQVGVLNYLIYYPRDGSWRERDHVIIWWTGEEPIVMGMKSLPPLDVIIDWGPKPAGILTPEVLDSLAAAGLLDLKKSGVCWDVTILPPARQIMEKRREALDALLKSLNAGKSSGTQLGLSDRAATIAKTDPPAPPVISGVAAERDAQETRVRLARLINDTFDSEELQNLCFDLGVDYGNLRGERKETKARDLASRMEKDGRLAELQRYLAEKRPAHYSAYMDPGT